MGEAGELAHSADVTCDMHGRDWIVEQARRHIAEGEQRIAEQELRLAALRRYGGDTCVAELLLDQFNWTRRVMLERLALEEQAQH
jgi:hypothetical protein